MVYAERFSPANGVYLLSHSVGRLPLAARGAVERGFFSPWEKQPGDPWQCWMGEIEKFRAALGSVFSTAAGNFCPQTNLSSALSKVLAALPVEPQRNVLLLSEDDFPSIAYVLAQAERLGYCTRFIPRARSICEADVWEEYLREDVALALLTHVQSNTSRMLDVQTVAALARERGILSVADIAQSAGVVPINLDAWDCDFVLGSCVKWLCGGPGAGHLWVNPRVLERCRPLDVGWFSHENPFEFDIHDFRYHPGALRFWGGTPSVLPFVLASAAIGVIDEIGVVTVRAHNLRLTQRLIDGVDEKALRSPALASQRGGTVVLDFGARQAEVLGKLQQQEIRFDARATGIRLSPHVYTSEAELDLVLECLAR